MTKTFKKFFIALLVVFAGLCVACAGMTPEEAIAGIKIENKADLTEDFTLPTEVEGFKGTITWTSDSPEIVIEGNTAKVVRPEYTNGGSVVVKLTVTAALKDVTAEKTISVTVKQKEQNLASKFVETYSVSVLGSALTSDFVLPTTDTFEGKEVSISWSSNSEYIVVDAQGNATVTRPSHDVSDNATVTLTATVTINGETATKPFTATVLKNIYQQLGTPITDAPTPGTPYKWGMIQTSKGSVYYFTGTMNGYYGATTTEAALGVDIYVEETTGGFYVYFLNASKKKQYVNGEASGTHLNFVFGDTAKSVWTWDTTCNSLVTKIGTTTCYAGTSGTYFTFGMMDVSKFNSTCYAGQFYVNDGSLPVPTMPDIYPLEGQPTAGTAYHLGTRQENLVKLVYATGELSGTYLATTEDATKAAAIYTEEVNGGFGLYFLNGDAKKYIKLVKGEKYTDVTLSTSAETVWTWNAEHQTFTTTIGSDVYYIGSYGTFTTLSASTIDKITTSYPARFFAVDAKELTDSERITKAKGELEALLNAYDGESNLDLPVSLYKATITWASSNEAIISKDGVITPAATDQKVTLTATIALDGQESQTVSVEVTVKAKAASKLSAIREEVIAANGTEVLVKFVAKIIGISNGCYIFADETSGLYSYAKTTVYCEAKVGDVLEVVGTAKLAYSCVEVTAVTESKVVSTEITPVAITEFTTAPVVKGITTAEALSSEFMNKFVKINGQLVIDGNYINVMVGDVKLSIKGVSTSDVSSLSGKTVTVTGYVGDANVKTGYWTVYAYGDTPLVEVGGTIPDPEPTPDPTPADENKIDFTEGFADLDWDENYAERNLEYASLNATVAFTRADKQRSGNTIDDRPVVAVKNSTEYVTLTITEGTLSSVTFDLKQWTTKTFSDIHIEYFDGTNWVTCSEVITTPAVISTNVTLPSGVNSVRLSLTSTTSKNVQVGISEITFNLNK